MSKDLTRTEFVPCACHSTEHLLVVEMIEYRATKNERDCDLFITTQLSPSFGFFKRIYYAFKYIFFPRVCKYGHWQETMVNTEGAKKIKKICEDYIDFHENRR